MQKILTIVAAIFLATSLNAQSKNLSLKKTNLQIKYQGKDTLFFIKRRKKFEQISYNGNEIPLQEMIQKSTCKCNDLHIKNIEISDVKIFKDQNQQPFGMFLQIAYKNLYKENTCIFTLTYNIEDKKWFYTDDDLRYN